MSGTKLIRNKIKSIQSTQKITKAMEMVAASKMNKALDRMSKARPYSDRISNVVEHFAKGNIDYQHPYLVEREIKTIGFIVISSNRGLCGGLNMNLFRTLLQVMKEHEQNGYKVEVCAIGNKAISFFKKFGGKLVAASSLSSDVPSMEELLGTISVMLKKFIDGSIDRLDIAYNKFINTMSQSPAVTQLLPVVSHQSKSNEDKNYTWEYIYEPNSQELIESIFNRYIESLVYRAVVENGACEQSARRMAMKTATDNAGEIIDSLRLKYNKARQAAITRELSEIVAGAAAISEG